ncbi:hypothetical protein VTJ04DRAFT_650 [Mycothermus thermophilus]|uniref:uncharacterized protein n=1 Tax=Humicola insolens TaxID=85995 RepID=UPI0037431DA3
MSQGDPSSHQISPPSTRSPARAADVASAASIQQQQSRGQQHHDARPTQQQHLRDSADFPLARGDGPDQQAPTTARGILNRLEPSGSVAAEPSYLQQSAPAPRHTRSATMGASPYAPPIGSPITSARPQTPTTSTPRPSTQPAPGLGSPGARPRTAPEHGSPQAHPASIAARRILTPKSPRAAGLSRAAMRSIEAAQHTGVLQGVAASRGTTASAYDPQSYGPGPSPLGTPPQFYSASSATTRPAIQSPTRPTSSLSRSLSHPTLSQDFSRPPPLEPTPSLGGVKREHGGQPVLSGPPYPTPFPTSQPLSAPSSWADARWTPVPLSAVDAKSLALAEGQPVITIQPQHGEEILVAVDVHQGSRQADQKRQRNAGASARFRQRKKEREREQQEEMQKLEAENRELTRRNEELMRQLQEVGEQRDFYRAERNRLRDALLRLPGGREWAEGGPPSPVLTPTKPEHYPSESNPQQHQAPPPLLPPPTSKTPQSHSESQQQKHQQPQHPPPPPPPFPPRTAPREPHHVRPASYGDISDFERPSRRRRTDSEPQPPTSSYRLLSQSQAPPPPPLLPTVTSGPAIPAPLPTPISLPPISHSLSGPSPPSFAIPPSPHVTPPLLPALPPHPPTAPPGSHSSGTARLPPLRFDASSSSSSLHHHHHHLPGQGQARVTATTTTPSATPPPGLAGPLPPPPPPGMARPGSRGGREYGGSSGVGVGAVTATTRPLPYETGWATEEGVGMGMKEDGAGARR